MVEGLVGDGGGMIHQIFLQETKGQVSRDMDIQVSFPTVFWLDGLSPTYLPIHCPYIHTTGDYL